MREDRINVTDLSVRLEINGRMENFPRLTNESRCCLLPCAFVILQNRLAPLLRPVKFELYAFVANTSLCISPAFLRQSFCPSLPTSSSWKSGAYVIGPNFSYRSDPTVIPAEKRIKFLPKTRMTDTTIVTLVPCYEQRSSELIIQRSFSRL